MHCFLFHTFESFSIALECTDDYIDKHSLGYSQLRQVDSLMKMELFPTTSIFDIIYAVLTYYSKKYHFKSLVKLGQICEE